MNTCSSKMINIFRIVCLFYDLFFSYWLIDSTKVFKQVSINKNKENLSFELFNKHF